MITYRVRIGEIRAWCEVDRHHRSFTVKLTHVSFSEGRVAHTFRPGDCMGDAFGGRIHIDRLGRTARRVFDGLTRLSETHRISFFTFDRCQLRVSFAREYEDCDQALGALMYYLSPAIVGRGKSASFERLNAAA